MTYHTNPTKPMLTNMYNIHNIQSECGKYQAIVRGILSVPHNIVLDLNNVMKLHCLPECCFKC